MQQFFFRKFISHRNEKTKQNKTKTKNKPHTHQQVLINKPVYLGLSISERSKLVMYESWYDYVKLKNGKKAKLCYVIKGSVTLHSIEKQKTFAWIL